MQLRSHKKRKIVSSPHRDKARLDRVPSRLETGIHQLQNDHTNGAHVLATNAITTLKEFLEELDSTSPQDSWDQARLAGYRLSMSRPSMSSAITSAVVQALNTVKNAWVQEIDYNWQKLYCSKNQLADLKEITRQCLITFVQEREVTGQKLSRNFEETLREIDVGLEQRVKILTLSSSSSLQRCLIHAVTSMKDLRFDFRVLESRPRCEGATFAAQLLCNLSTKPSEEQLAALRYSGQDTTSYQGQSDQSFKLVVAPDSHVCNLARNIDIVLIGADRISAAGDVSNKMGSYAAVLCAKHISPSVKVIVLSTTDKIARSGSTEEHAPENNNPSEVISGWDDKTQQHVNFFDRNQFTVENIYFEWIPASYVDIYLTEQGALDIAKICEISAHKEQLEREVFDDKIIKMAEKV